MNARREALCFGIESRGVSSLARDDNFIHDFIERQAPDDGWIGGIGNIHGHEIRSIVEINKISLSGHCAVRSADPPDKFEALAVSVARATDLRYRDKDDQ